MPANRYPNDNSKLEETEFALSISPCPHIEGARKIGDGAEPASTRSGPGDRRRVQRPRQTVFHDNDLTETLTIGWAIALAIAVALVVYTSGA